MISISGCEIGCLTALGSQRFSQSEAEKSAKMRYRWGMYEFAGKFFANTCAIWVVLVH